MTINQLNDKEWQFLEKLVRSGKGLRGRPPTQHRQIFEAIFWVAENNRPWRDLPENASKWNTVYRQFKRWSENGLWTKAIGQIDKAPDQGGHYAELRAKIQAASKLATERVR